MNCSEQHILGRTENWRDYPEVAIANLEEFLVTSPLSIRVKLHLASIYVNDYGLGIAGAERLFREILQQDGGNLAAMCGLALLHGHPHSSVTAAESLDLLERAVALSGDPDVIRNLANKAWEMGLEEKALSALESLRAAASGPRSQYFLRVAEESERAIKQGEKPGAFVYYLPEGFETET